MVGAGDPVDAEGGGMKKKTLKDLHAMLEKHGTSMSSKHWTVMVKYYPGSWWEFCASMELGENCFPMDNPDEMSFSE